MTDGSLGALLGTKGQALAMKAFATRDLSMNRDAELHFVAARSCFDQAGDIDRQPARADHRLLPAEGRVVLHQAVDPPAHTPSPAGG